MEELMVGNAMHKVRVKKYKPRNEKYCERNNDLICRARDGDEQAINALIKENERAISHIARRFLDQGVEYDDLLQAGRIGIMRAAKKFDLSRGVTFHHYAINWIRALIWEEVRNNRSDIYIPRNAHELVVQITRYRDKFFILHGHNPTDEETTTALTKQFIEKFTKKYGVKPDQKKI